MDPLALSSVTSSTSANEEDDIEAIVNEVEKQLEDQKAKQAQ